VTFPRTTGSRQTSGSLAGLRLCMVMHLGNSGGSRAWQGLLGRRPDWGIDPHPRSTGVRKGSSYGHRARFRCVQSPFRDRDSGRSTEHDRYADVSMFREACGGGFVVLSIPCTCCQARTKAARWSCRRGRDGFLCSHGHRLPCMRLPERSIPGRYGSGPQDRSAVVCLTSWPGRPRESPHLRRHGRRYRSVAGRSHRGA